MLVTGGVQLSIGISVLLVLHRIQQRVKSKDTLRGNFIRNEQSQPIDIILDVIIDLSRTNRMCIIDLLDRGNRHGRRGNPRQLPKNLKFDGSTCWLSSKQKFDSYSPVLWWFENKYRDYLSWSLEGKALDFLTIMSESSKDVLVILPDYEETGKTFWIKGTGRNCEG